MPQMGRTIEVVKTGQEIAAKFYKTSEPFNIIVWSAVCCSNVHETVTFLFFWKNLDIVSKIALASGITGVESGIF